MREPFSDAAAARQRLQADLAFWQQQDDRLALDARRLRYVPLGGIAASTLAWLAKAPLWAVLGLVGLGVTIGVMAVYMVFVRRQEYRQQLSEVRAKLAALDA